MIGHEAIASHNAPDADGLYAVEIYFGWKLLEWKDGSWWHTNTNARWMAGDVVQWVGPLPGRRGMRAKPDYDL